MRPDYLFLYKQRDKKEWNDWLLLAVICVLVLILTVFSLKWSRKIRVSSFLIFSSSSLVALTIRLFLLPYPSLSPSPPSRRTIFYLYFPLYGPSPTFWIIYSLTLRIPSTSLSPSSTSLSPVAFFYFSRFYCNLFSLSPLISLSPLFSPISLSVYSRLPPCNLSALISLYNLAMIIYFFVIQTPIINNIDTPFSIVLEIVVAD